MNTPRISLTGIAIAILLLSSTINLSAQKAGLFLDGWEARTAVFPDFEMGTKPAEAATVTVTIDTSQVIHKVPPTVFGNNAVTWDNGLHTHATGMEDMMNLNPHVIRWPGGSLSNSYFWNRSWQNGPDDIPVSIGVWGGMDGDWNMSLNQYYAFLENTDSDGCIVVNYSYARYGTSEDPVAAAAHLAADWVRYDNGRTKFWEIGNENFGNWEHGNQIDLTANKDGQPEYISGQLYGQHCKVFIDSMRAAATETGADINIGVVVYDAESSWDPISEVWNEGMMPEVGDLADFLSVHSYFTPYDEDSPPGTILNSHTVPGNIYNVLEADMAEAGKTMLPVAMTEWNIFAVRSMQQVSYVNGMHAALTLGELIKNGYGMGNRWDLVNGWSDGDDHAMFSSGGEPGVDEYNPRPAFFYMYYFQNYFGDRMVESEVTGSSSVVAYASTFSSGDCGTVLINKSETGQTVELDIEDFTPGSKYYTMTLTGGADNGDFSRKVYLNGVGTDEEGGGPDEYEDVKAIALDTVGGITVDLPPLGVVYVLVEKNTLEYVYSKLESDPSVVDIEFSDEVVFTAEPTGFVVNVNWSGSRSITKIEIDAEDAHWIHITLDAVIEPTDDVTISYSGSEIATADGILLKPFISELADNLLPGAPPKLTEAMTNENGSEIYLTFTKNMTIEVGENDDFTLVADGDPDIDIAIAGVTLDHLDSQRAILDISDPIYAEYVLRLSYSGTSLESSEAVPLGTIMGFPVENNAPEPIIFDIPGTIDAELYTVNNGMNLETCYDVGGGNNLSEIDVGDWVEYMIDVEKTGYYIGFIRTSGAGGVGQLTIQSPDAEVVDLDTVTLPITGNWQTWASTPVEIILYEGEQRLRLYANTNGYNINWLSLEFEKDLDVARPLQGQKIMVYPNPVSDRLYINAGGAGICSLEIINISGKKVMYREYDASPSQLTLDLDISEGLYLMKLNTGSQIMVTRLIVE